MLQTRRLRRTIMIARRIAPRLIRIILRITRTSSIIMRKLKIPRQVRIIILRLISQIRIIRFRKGCRLQERGGRCC